MLFNSLHFLIFFPVITLIYFCLPHKYRWVLLLAGSYYFYMSWKAEYVLLIIFSTLVDYFAGIRMSNTKTLKAKKILLALSLICNLGLLFLFKYFNFFSDSVRELLSHFTIQLHPVTLSVLLPVGISFYTFQTLSYTIDVYRNKIKPERHLGIFALYVAFFPQLVAGPIERAKNLLPQFAEKKLFDYDRVTSGIRLMLWGFFKKLVIADRLALIVDIVYNNAGNYSGISLAMATVFFAFQIYCDFSGYSDIAIGAARVMGFRLMTNFRMPYLAKSVSDFWRRWHISLYSWFRDYLYIPLGGSRCSKKRTHFNMLLVFLVSGLWHGANWTFVLWGLLHGIYLVIGSITSTIRKKIAALVGLVKIPRVQAVASIILTFILVNIGWIFFRANSLSDAWYILTHITSGFSLSLKTAGVNLGAGGWLLHFGFIGFVLLVELVQEKVGFGRLFLRRNVLIRYGVYCSIVMVILLFGIFYNMQFIYFQF
ncbi:MBOAT family protein [Candidatus Woesearchaeota archaeon]|nr:MBOAT family protein [Candidatus Woesearchaeota archaeon]